MRSTLSRRLLLPVAAAAAVGIALTGCTGDAPPAATSDADCADYEQYGTFEGETVSMYGTIIEVEADALNESWADFASCTGINIEYQGTQEFEAQVRVLVEGGTAPDLAIFPQPGLFQNFANDIVVPSDETLANIDEFWSDDWAGYGQIDGEQLGAPLMASVKGFVWYSPSVFEEAGYEIPTTLAELTELSDKIVADGAMKPWCVGFGSGAASGWPGTDWVEDMVLRLHGPEVYDQWITHEIPFNDPKIVEAFDAVGDIIKNEDYVNGGLGDVKSINDITFNDGGLPVASGECGMHHQATFYSSFWPEGTEIAPDGDIWAFLTPGVEAGASAVTGGGEVVAAFTDRPEVQAVQTYLSSDTWANTRVKLGGVLSANSGLDASNASSELLTEAIGILQDPNTTFRFDASDLMPAAVGSDTFFKGMVAWVGGQDTQTTVDAIEASWPAS